MPRCARVLALAATSAAALLPVASASAAPTWLPPHQALPMAQDAYSYGNDVAMDATGNVVSVFAHEEQVGGVGRTVVRGVTRLAGGSFSGATILSDTTKDAFSPIVQMDAGGNAVIVWVSDGIVRLRTWSAGAGYSGTASVGGSSTPGAGASDPALAVLPDGTAYITWVRASGATQFVQGTIRSPSGSYSATKDLSAVHKSVRQNLVMANAAGDVTAAWVSFDDTPKNRVYATRTSGGAPLPDAGTEQLVDGGAADFVGRLSGAVAADGKAILIWTRADQLKYASRTGTAFGTPQSLDPGTQRYEPDVAMDDEGTAHAVWYRYTGTTYEIRAASKPAGGAFGVVQPLSDAGTGTAFGPTVTVDRQSNTPIAVWAKALSGSDAGEYVIQSARRQPNGLYGGVSDIASRPGGFSVAVASNARGDAVADFVTFRYDSAAPFGSYYGHALAGFDGAAPQQRDVVIPTAGLAGQPLTMSVSPFDVWSAATTTWSFGDGTTATGNAVQHAFATPGTYTVTATTRDAVGNESATTRTVQIVAADADGDGSPAGQDCNDTNPGIRPGAVDIPGNGVDEDCDGRDATVRLASGFGYGWKAYRRYTIATSLSVTKIPAGAKVTVRCKGRGCPFKVKRKSFKKFTRIYNVAKLFNRRKGGKRRFARLRPRTRIEIRVTKPNTIGRYATFVVRSGKIPTFKSGCLSVAGNKTRC